MLNYWIAQKDLKIVTVAIPCTFIPARVAQLDWIDLTTSLGNKFRCRVSEDMLCVGRLNPVIELDDLLSEKEWEMAERYAEKVFFDAGLLKEKVWDTDNIN